MVWTKITSGRAENDIASTFVKIIKKVAKDNAHIIGIVCWSDSCPSPLKKNRNSHISQAVLEFLSSNSQILFIMMKYSIPGHSCVQEVDNMHRQVQDVMRISEFYSPLLFIRVLAKSIETNLSRWWLHEFCKASSFSNHTFSKVYQFRFSRDSIYNM